MADPKRSIVLDPSRMQLAEQWRQDWIVNAEEGTTIQDIMEPGYWAHMSHLNRQQLQVFDHIEVRLETGQWVAELLVVQTGMNWAKVHLLHLYDLVAVQEDAPAAQKHEVFWRGPQHKFAVKRIADNEVVQNGFPDRETAILWMRNHEKATT